MRAVRLSPPVLSSLRSMKTLILVVALVALLGSQQNACVSAFGFSTNDLVDLGLKAVDVSLFLGGKNSLALPDFKVTYDETVLFFIQVPGNLTATRGELTHLSELKRVGDATLTSDANSKSIELVLQPSNLQLSYHYVVRRGQGDVALPGQITASVPTTFKVKAGLAKSNGKCTIGVESLEVQSVDKIDVEATGFATKSFLFPKVEAKVTSIVKDGITTLKSKWNPLAPVDFPCLFFDL